MKKLLGSIFVRAQASAASPSASSAASGAYSDAPSSASRWGAFLSQPAPAADQEVIQRLDALLHGLAAQIKAAIAKNVEAAECDEELRTLAQLMEHARTQFEQQACELSVEILKSYFSSPMGAAFCEQTAFPSLVLDFVGKMRRLAMKEELNHMANAFVDGKEGAMENEQVSSICTTSQVTRSETHVSFTDALSPLEFLMSCVVAIASNEALMETFRCELPNLIELTAEDYPPMTNFIRDCCSRALRSMPKRNFNAGLAWYLLDCNVIAKAVQLMTNYSFATPTTPEKAAQALELYVNKPAEHAIHRSSGEGLNDSAAEAAVSEALGLTRTKECPSERQAVTPPGCPPVVPTPENLHSEVDADPPNLSETFCLPSYDVRIGLKSVIYVLENTSRFTVALLDEFQATGGYVLMLSLLDTCNEEEIPTLLNMLTLLIPLGMHSTDGGAERITGGGMLGARNVNAFIAMRDLLLKYVTEVGSNVEHSKDRDVATQSRNEHLVLQLLTQILHVYTSAYGNFVLLEPKTRTLALLLTKLPGIAFYDAQVIILRIVEYVCCAARPDDPLPYEILAIVCGLIIGYGPLKCTSEIRPDESSICAESTIDVLLSAFKEGPRLTLSTLICECLIKILQCCETDICRKELSGFGLMERGVYVWLVKISTCLGGIPQNDELTRHIVVTALESHLKLYSNMVCLMLRNNSQECVQFRQSRIHQSLYDIAEMLISDGSEEGHMCESSFSVMAVFVELFACLRSKSVSSNGRELMSDLLLLQNGIESDLGMILELIQRFRGAMWRQNLLLHVLITMLKAGGPLLSKSWKICQGYEILVALLSSLDFSESISDEPAYKMMGLVLDVLNVTLDLQHGGKQNSEYFKSIAGYSTVASCIISSGVLDSDLREAVLNRVFNLIGGANPPKEIRSGDAVQIIFRLLPGLHSSDAAAAMTRLLQMIEEGGAYNTLPKREQVVRLVRAGALKWMHDPAILMMITQTDHQLKTYLTKWLLLLATENDLSVPCLQDFLELAGKAMPMLLTNRWYPRLLEDGSATQSPEIGLQLLESALQSPAIRHIHVGKPQGAEQVGRYVHIVNSDDRVWPPSSGYSFSCWLKFPAGAISSGKPKSDLERDKKIPLAPTTSVALCEGPITVSPEGGNTTPTGTYGVLVGCSLTLFPSNDCAMEKQDVIDELKVKTFDRTGILDFSIRTVNGAFRASCIDVENAEMWWRAMKQCGNSKLVEINDSSSGPISGDDLLASLESMIDSGATARPTNDIPRDTAEGSACIVSVYSLESSGCFVRAFFEQSTGFLRIHTGAATSVSNLNPKHTSVVFEDLAIQDLRPALTSSGEVSTGENSVSTSDCSFSGPVERKRDWHHFAFTHRKAVVGSSLMTVYIDGQEIATKKLNFPSVPSAGPFQAFVGSDAQVCSPQSALSWKIGPAWLTDDVISSSTIASMFSLGPTFSHHFSGHFYRSVGDCPEALASSHLARAADRGIEIAQFARRLHLPRLGRSCRRQWHDWNESNTVSSVQNANNDSVAASAALIAESMMAKKDELAEGLRLAAAGGGMVSRKEKTKVAAFRNFINDDCAMSLFGAEIESHLDSCKLSEDAVLFTLNTTCSDEANTSLMASTQVHYINCEQSCQLDLARSLPSVGGISQVLLPLLDNAWRQCEFHIVLKMLVSVFRRNSSCLAECIESSRYTFVAALLCARVDLIDEDALTSIVQLAISGKLTPYATPHVGATIATRLAHPVVVDSVALAQVVFYRDLRMKLPHHLQCQLMSILMDLLVDSNPNALFNARQLRRAGLLRWIITYLSELGNEECELNQATALEMKWCFPKFTETMFEAILQYALSLLRAFLRMESHVDDFYDIAEVLLVSLTSEAMHAKRSPIRLILLQFLLHEIENDASNEEGGDLSERTSKCEGSAVQCISATIVETILHRESGIPRTKKRDDNRVENSTSLETASLGSPLADPLKTATRFGRVSSPEYPVDNFAIILLGVIDQNIDNGRWVSAEALVAVRILISLAQMYSKFAERLLCQTIMKRKLRQVLLKYSTGCSMYIPLLAYVSNIPIGDTIYYDPETLLTTKAGPQSFSLPSPSSKTLSSGKCIDHVWDLIGALLCQNCQLGNNKNAREINVVVFQKIAFLVRSSLLFFESVCKSSGTLFRIIVQCMLCHPEEDTTPADEEASSIPNDRDVLFGDRYHSFIRSIESIGLQHSDATNSSDACLNLMGVIMSRALSDSEEFASLMMHFLECLDDGIPKQGGKRSILSRIGGQECWLELVKHVIQSKAALSDNCTLAYLKNICTLCVALSRYLADDANHHVRDTTSQLSELDNQNIAVEIVSPVVPNPGGPEIKPVGCFGVKAFFFVLDCCKMCSNSNTKQVVGIDQQHFFCGSLVFCLQTIVLNEFGGAHRELPPSQTLLNSILKSKDVLLQQPKWQGVILCGVPTQGAVGDNSGGGETNNNIAPSARRPRRMNRIRSLSTNSHKEFGVGAESDRSFILSLAAQLFKMLMDDSRSVRHSAILLWQFLMDQRFEVIKELLIAEPRTSLLHSITTTKKETSVDVFHGGFDRLLFALPDAAADEDDSSLEIKNIDDTLLNQEVWCQFQLWLTENISALTDLIVTRTETIHRHIMEVLLTCVCLQILPSTDVLQKSCLETNFPVRADVRGETNADDDLFLPTDAILDGCEITVSKALTRFLSLRDSGLESMNDGVLRWQETSLRLACTRNIWRTGMWQADATNNNNIRDVGASGVEFELQRSIFQRRSLRYRLDTTEGPLRMRLRLGRDYFVENKLPTNRPGSAEPNEGELDETKDKDTLAVSSLQTPPSRFEQVSNEPFKRSLEFHDALEAFREVVYLHTTAATREGEQPQALQSILTRCKIDLTRDLFSEFIESKDDEETIGVHKIIAIARKVYRVFLEDEIISGAKRILGVSQSIIADINRLITMAAENPEAHPIPFTIFDAADAEATQYALFAVRSGSSRSLTERSETLGGTANGETDDEIDETPLGSVLPVDGAESDDSDDQEVSKPNMIEATLSNKARPDRSEINTCEPLDTPSSGATSPNSEFSQTNKQVDTSSDSVYGAIARFLQHDDYPPIRSYNAMYVVGMGRTPGLFVISRFRLYFIGGYVKLGSVEESEPRYVAGDCVTNPVSLVGIDSSLDTISSQPNYQSETPKSVKRKTTKTLLRAALADISMQFAQSKGASEHFFTVVPLPELSIQHAGSTDIAASLSPIETQPSKRNSCWSVKYSNVKQFCRIKYQLRPVGIEFFDTFGSTYFLQLESFGEREEVVKLLFQMPLVNSIFWTPVLRTGALAPSIKRIRHTLTKRWLRGTISNFEYLMHLNTLAGRSFNDLTQYPVFPWVVADYTSEVLDLYASDSFRDLSKPMGAIGESRAKQFCERYAAMSQDVDVDGPMGTPAFHYGTHYSCSAYVINYLIRLQPFTDLALELQGGVFDHPDRLFRSIPSSWNSASSENLQDVRELIPEFFYLPEFLYNANDCVFGTTQSGEDVCHVILPPWAHSDPREFVRLHRRALESKYVSEHLHEWIDLVFGVKQTGSAAVKAQNVFMHITYEGTVDIEQITDPVMRAATLSQIENFGQTPSRLFSGPHPQRKVPTLLPTQPIVAVAVDSGTPLVSSPVVGHQYDGNTLSSIEAYVKWHTPLAPALVSIGKDYVYLKKHSLITAQVIGGAVGDLKLVNDKMQWLGIDCVFVPPRFAKYLDWGNSGGVMKLRVHQQTSGAGRYREANKVLAVIEGAHHDLVNCAALSDDGTLLVTGGQDAVVNLIECSKASDGRRVFKQMTKLVGHNDSVACVAINKEFNLIASSSADCSALLWDLRTRALLQELAGHSATVTHVSINSANGNVLTTTTSELRLWSINGDLLASSSSSAYGLQSITCAISTRCESWQNGVVAVTGHANGAIALWGLRYPSDLARQKREVEDAEASAVAKQNLHQSPSGSNSLASSPRRVDPCNVAVSISSQGAPSSVRKLVIPSCQLFVLKLLLDHRVRVTALTLGPEQRQLLSGDADGNCIRWIDDSISTNIH